MPGDDLEAALDRLYGLPLAEFVDARNALAARLKAAGDRPAAEQVKSLRKPSAPAWAVNQVYRRARGEFDGLMDAARRLRARQQAAGPSSASDLRDAMRERREALSRALDRAGAILAGAGHAANPATLQRVAATLEALAAQAGQAPAPPGRLTQELEAPGFEALAFPVPPAPSTAGPPPAKAPPAEAETRAARARNESEVSARRRAAESAAAAGAESQRRLEAARAAFDEAQRRLAEATQRARDAEEAAQRADAALADAERTLAEARADTGR